ncbi:MAG: pilus assembly protein TadG-related protein [Pacificimonas sp.]
MAIGIVTSLSAMGAGVDMSRAYLAQTELQIAVDAAALAGGRTLRLDTGASDTIDPGSEAYIAINEYFGANFPPGYLGSSLKPLTIKGERKGSDVDIEVAAEGVISTTFAAVLGIDTLPISASSNAETSRDLDAKPAEVMLVLDNTGSMASGSRMSDMKNAVGEFLEVVYGEEEVQNDIAIGMLPYNTMVNVGYAIPAADRDKYINKMSHFTHEGASASTDWMDVKYGKDHGHRFKWKGCVRADNTIKTVSGDASDLNTSHFNSIDAGAWDIGKSMPGENAGHEKIEPFYYPPILVESFQNIDNRFKIHSNLSTANELINSKEWHVVRKYVKDHYNDEVDSPDDDGDGDGYNDIDVNSDTSTDGGERRIYMQYIAHPSKNGDDEYDDWPWPKNYDFRSGISNKSINGRSPNYQCPSPALPIEYGATKTVLSNYVKNENKALNPGTGTFHNTAMTWAYRLLERDDIFTRTPTSTIGPKKYIVFMTDGNFDSRDDGDNGPDGVFRRNTAFTAYGTYDDRELIESEDKNKVIDALILRFAKTCEAAKRDGIEVYTIAFELNSNTQGTKTRNMFKKCATNEATHFFDAADGSELEFAYRSIASDLTELHLSR